MLSNSYGIAWVICNTLTAPLTVLGVTMQLSVKPNLNFYGEEVKEVSKLKLAKNYDLAVRERRYNELQLKSGATATNRPFRAPIYHNYREALLGLSGQGYLAFYKGNGVLSLFCYLTTFTKVVLSNIFYVSYFEPGLLRHLLSLGILSLADIILHPLHNASTRFILQNRLPEFSAYKSTYFMLSKIRSRGMYQGWSCVFPMHFLSSVFALSLVSDASYDAQVAGGMIGYSLVYPLSTVQRRLEVQSSDHSMLPRRYIGVRYALSRIYNEEGLFRGLYRGFFCCGLAAFVKIGFVPLITSAIMRGMVYEQYKQEGWNL